MDMDARDRHHWRWCNGAYACDTRSIAISILQPTDRYHKAIAETLNCLHPPLHITCHRHSIYINSYVVRQIAIVMSDDLPSINITFVLRQALIFVEFNLPLISGLKHPPTNQPFLALTDAMLPYGW
jgi:hypothetical protein